MDWSNDFDTFENCKSFFAPGSNLVTDFHGDPGSSELVVLSDGNHHMALKETLQAFHAAHPGLNGYFYATTPPEPILHLLKGGRLKLGNLVICVSPHVFIGPPEICAALHAEKFLETPRPFIRNQGNVILIKKGNPKKIESIADLTRPDIILFLSNPATEKASYNAYMDTMINLSGNPDIKSSLNILYGRCIHHREAPASLAEGKADAAVIFYHLARHLAKKFPGLFDFIPLGGTRDFPDPEKGNIIGNTSVAAVKGGGPYGKRFVDFILSKPTAKIYKSHGLIPLF